MTPTLHPGEPAPQDGAYQDHNVFGTPSAQKVILRAGERLPPLPIGFTWKLVDHQGPERAMRPSVDPDRATGRYAAPGKAHTRDDDLLLSDPVAAARRDAREIMALAPMRRADALAELGDAYAAQAELNLCLPVDAALFGLKMRRLIEDAMRAMETGICTSG